MFENMQPTAIMGKSCSELNAREFQVRHHMPTGAVLIASVPFIISTNSLLIACFRATRQTTKNTSNFLLICLASVNLFTGICVAPLLGYKLLLQSENICVLAFVVEVLVAATNMMYAYLTSLIAIDRYVHMNPDFYNKPSKWAKLFEKPRLKVNLIIMILVCFALQFLFIYIKITGFVGCAIVAILFALIGTIFLLILLISYVRGYLRIRRFIADNSSFVNRSTDVTSNKPMYLKQLYKTIMILLVTSFCQIIPFCLSSLVSSILILIDHRSIPRTLLLVNSGSVLLLFLGPIIDPLIILYRNKEAKQWLIAKFTSFTCPARVNDV